MASRVRPRFEMTDYEAALAQARKAVGKEEEPFRSIAYKVILTHLLVLQQPPIPQIQNTVPIIQNNGHDGIEANEPAKPEKPAQVKVKFDIPQDLFPLVVTLKNETEKGMIVWSYSSVASMTIKGFIMAARDHRIPFTDSWLNGSNFNRDLVKTRMMIKDGKDGKAIKYKLSAPGLIKVQNLIKELQNPPTDTKS